MAANGQLLAADLARLLTLGQVDLPQMAYIYARLNREVAGTASGDVGAFSPGQAAKGDGDAIGAAYQSWAAMRDLLQDALATAALRLEEAGRAIVSIAHTYLATDAEAASALRALLPGGVPAADRLDDLPTTPGTVVFSTGDQRS